MTIPTNFSLKISPLRPSMTFPLSSPLPPAPHEASHFYARIGRLNDLSSLYGGSQSLDEFNPFAFLNQHMNNLRHVARTFSLFLRGQAEEGQVVGLIFGSRQILATILLARVWSNLFSNLQKTILTGMEPHRHPSLLWMGC
ncbi:Uncharacterized protein Fot_16618 [Forsythia ovata]|uniref:Uncharacterized protein n=1 Tax=Forsythia ovata TaxID=205694 RepID=A0ABD1VCZ8_9LAMI